MQQRGRALLIINPISGTTSKVDLAGIVVPILKDGGFDDVDVRFTEGPGHATRLAAEAVTAGYSAVIAAGGDGTVNETARALCDTGVPLGIIPSGSGNGLARHLEIPIDPKESARVIASSEIFRGDYCTVNDTPFFCTFGVGYDAAVSHNFAKKGHRGLRTYLKSCMQELMHYSAETYTISANGRILTERAFSVACCNASQYGNNAYIAPNASIADGLLDIIIIHQGTPLDTAMVGVDLMTGYINKNTMIDHILAPSAVIYRNSPGMAHVDGEPTMLPEIMEVKCHHGALSFLAPAETHDFHPLVTPINSFWKEAALKIRHIFGK